VSGILRGTARGLEIEIDESRPLYEVLAELETRLAQSPGFFDGHDAHVNLGARQLPPGGLAHLKAVTDRFGVRIVSLKTEREDIQSAAAHLAIPVANTNASPSLTPPSNPWMGSRRASPSGQAGSYPPGELAIDAARLVTGPLRSGAVIESPSHLVVIGDVNPGAEVRAGGNIIILGALRGLAHAAVLSGEESPQSPAGSFDTGYIIALRLDAQQIRIGSLIARAADAGDGAIRAAEIAYAAEGRIIVEPYQGRLPGKR
jgi:septum site-determining protein MinC